MDNQKFTGKIQILPDRQFKLDWNSGKLATCKKIILSLTLFQPQNPFGYLKMETKTISADLYTRLARHSTPPFTPVFTNHRILGLHSISGHSVDKRD